MVNDREMNKYDKAATEVFLIAQAAFLRAWKHSPNQIWSSGAADAAIGRMAVALLGDGDANRIDEYSAMYDERLLQLACLADSETTG